MISPKRQGDKKVPPQFTMNDVVIVKLCTDEISMLILEQLDEPEDEQLIRIICLSLATQIYTKTYRHLFHLINKKC